MKNNLLKKMCLGIMMLLGGVIYAQTVSGTISDANGALPGASVVVKGTANGINTDFDGNYTLNNVPSDAVLVVSFLGYVTQEINVAGQTAINVTLAQDANELNEIVIIGYGAQTRGDITGSVSSVNLDDAFKSPVVNVAEALEGRVTGVNVINSGQPGDAPKITIRGFGTINSTGPLYIIDGVQTRDADLLNSINPGDIEQFNVLKDGAAAIYGSRASNGVIIITTKGGGYGMGKSTLTVDAYMGTTQATDLPQLLNPQQHADMIFKSLANDGVTVEHAQYGSGPTPTLPSTIQGTGIPVMNVTPGGTNWLDEIFQVGKTESVAISLQNGSENGKSFMSVNYLNKDGVQLFTGYKRLSTRLNSEFKIGERIRIGEHMNVSYSNQKTGNETQFAFRMSPLVPVRDVDGNFAGTYNSSTGLGNARNSVAKLHRNKDNFNKELRVFGDVYLTADLIDGLKFKTTLSGNISSSDARRFLPFEPEDSEARSNNELQIRTTNSTSWTWSNTLNYIKNFGDHSINALVGVEALKAHNTGYGVNRQDYLFENPEFYTLNTGTGTPSVDAVFDNGYSLFSVFGTANYSYQGKYLFTGTLRSDTTSRFAGDNKTGVFPSFSGGWVISKEDFFPQDGLINTLKIKASWGELGNQSLPVENPTLNIYNIDSRRAFYSLNGTSITSGAKLGQVGNPDLIWETSVAKNFGIDLTMFDSALSLGLDLYQITTKDLIVLDRSKITITAIDATAPYVNVGTIRNTGFDLSLGYNNETESGFSYGINANISSYKNEVLELSTILTDQKGNRIGDISRTQVGQPISSFYGRVINGFTPEGRWTFKGGGTDDSREFIGSPHPDYSFGININAAYKGFDTQIFFTGVQGNEIFNYTKYYTDFPAFFDGNRTVAVLNTWDTNPNGNPSTTLPALSKGIQGNEAQPNTYYVEDGSFVRLKNVQFGYTFSSAIASKLSMSSLRLYLQGTNLWTKTDYTGLDPEISGGSNTELGIDDSVYPVAKVLTLGLNIKF